MPMKQKISFNTDGLKEVGRGFLGFLGDITPFVVIAGVFVGVIGGIGWAIESDHNNDNFLEDQRSLELNGITYQLSDAHLVSTIEGQIGYEMNFHAKTVVIDRPGRDHDDMVPFADFTNSAQIDDNRTAGVRIARQILNTKETIAESDMAHMEGREKYKDLVSDAKVFAETYGPENTEQDNNLKEAAAKPPAAPSL